ncbi:MAG: elongation factor G, partial [Dehalococcoidia bacterium]
TGGHGQYARVALRVEPRNRGDGFEFGNEIVGGAVPRQYIPAVEKGVTESLPESGLAKYPLTDLRVVLFDGKHHDVDSSEMAFKIAASQALKEAAQKARPILLEPIMTYRISVPESATGDVMSDLNGRRARVQGMEPSGDGRTVVSAEGPMAEFLHYATDLRSMTGGRGTFSFEFARYDPVPEHVAQKVVEKSKAGAKATS